jgi:hypothetical protein
MLKAQTPEEVTEYLASAYLQRLIGSIAKIHKDKYVKTGSYPNCRGVVQEISYHQGLLRIKFKAGSVEHSVPSHELQELMTFEHAPHLEIYELDNAELHEVCGGLLQFRSSDGRNAVTFIPAGGALQDDGAYAS